MSTLLVLACACDQCRRLLQQLAGAQAPMHMTGACPVLVPCQVTLLAENLSLCLHPAKETCNEVSLECTPVHWFWQLWR